MAHVHEPQPAHDTTVVEDRGYGALVAVAAILAIVVIGLAVLWSAPWDDDSGSNDIAPNPDITDDSGDVPVPDVPNPDVPAPDGGGDGSGAGGEQPAQ